MKVTKYPQSCLILEENGKRLVIDPGSLVSAKYQAQDLGTVDAILITHEHPDHADPHLVQAMAMSGVPVVANRSAANVLGEIVTKVVNDNEKFEVADMQITARELPHCLMADGSPGPQNTGYVVNSAFFHAGDGVYLEGLQVAAAAIPLAGPDISPKDVFDFIKQLGCQTVVPIHHDIFPANPKLFVSMGQKAAPNTKFVLLEHGQSAEL